VLHRERGPQEPNVTTSYPRHVTAHRLTRRRFISRLGKGTLAIAIFGPMACSDNGTATTARASTTTTTAAPPPTPAAGTAATTAPTNTEAPPATAAIATSWERVNLGFVSAYIIVRNDIAAIVDTGSRGSEGDIEDSLRGIGLGWDAVDHVIVTHLHPDHQGSLGAVLERAPEATAYAGEADISGIDSPRPLTSVGDGNDVFGLQIVETPGHTAGHIAVLDPVGSVLVAGDALNTASGAVAGSDPRYTADALAADASVQKLAALEFDVLLPGHGEPITALASAQVAAFAAGI